MAVERTAYREAMARLGAAVNVITSDGPSGRSGFTASAVCSVTDEPPTLLVCVNRSNDSHAVLRENGVFCVNTLTSAHQDLSSVFAGVGDLTHEARFASGGAWVRMETGSPALDGAAVSFDCRVIHVVAVGTHDVFFGEVVAVRQGDTHEGLIYFGRAYHRVAPPSPIPLP